LHELCIGEGQEDRARITRVNRGIRGSNGSEGAKGGRNEGVVPICDQGVYPLESSRRPGASWKTVRVRRC
jgi:hypothetical protein